MRLLILIPLIISSFLFGQEKNEDHSRHLVGFNANTISGVGPSYRFEHKRFATQLTFSGYKFGSRIKFNGGSSVMYAVHRTKNSEYYLGLSARYKQLNDQVFEREDDILSFNTEMTRQLNGGIHLDIHRRFENKISLNLSFGYGIYNVFGHVWYVDKGVPHPHRPIGIYRFMTTITGGISIYYKL